MTLKKAIYLSALFILLGVLNSYAQDKIYKTNGDIIEVKVIAVEAEEITYKLFIDLNGPIYRIEKKQIIKVVYENGTSETYESKAKKNLLKIEEKRAQNLYLEIVGQGLLLTANYDTRFSKKANGIGGRIGFGMIGGGHEAFVSVPVSLNYVLGNKQNLFEIGLGVTYFKIPDSFFDGGEGFVGTTSFMYRFQPVKNGFSFRAGLSPVFDKDGFYPVPGLSLGYSFCKNSSKPKTAHDL